MQAKSHNPVPEMSPGPDSGQATVLLILMLSTFLLAVMAFAIDLTGLWFHRQSAQSAADAACLAGASDMLAKRAGLTPPGTFSVGTNSDCSASASAPLCKYAAFNGYSGSGITNTASNSVSWTFPSSVPGATSPGGSNPYLQVSVVENVKTYFTGFLKSSNYQKVAASSTCGIAAVRTAPPVVVLHPSMSGAFTYTGGGNLDILGGPSRGVQVNSSNSTGISWHASAFIDTSRGGPNQTGSDVATYGGPSSSPGTGAFVGGSTGGWSGSNLPMADPFAGTNEPASVKLITPALGVNGKQVAHLINGCPDNGSYGCKEFSPGYYPTGLNISTAMNDYSTAIFDPGIYYFNGPFVIGHGSTMRMAKPSGYQQTDGVMFYFLSGGLNISGCSGCANSDDPVNSRDLTCDGSLPDASLGMPATIFGNVLWAQCTNNGTYFDAGGDTTDTRGAPGNRGLLLFNAHSNVTNPGAFYTGSGALAFSGTLYLHSDPAYAAILNVSGGSSTGTYILGDIIADQISLTGSGATKLALNPAKTIQVAKVALLQ